MSNVITYNILLEFQYKKDKNLLLDLLLEHQKVWNYISEYVFKTKQSDKKIIHDDNYHQCRKIFSNCPSQVIIRAKDSVVSTYKSIKSNKKLSKLVEPAKQENLSIRLDKRIYTFLDNNQIKLTTTGKRITCNYSPYPKFQELLSKYSICDPLIFIKNNEFWLAVSFEIPSPILIENTYLGVDLGINRLITTSEGNSISDKKFLKEKRRLRYNKRMLKSKLDISKSRSAQKKLNSLKFKEHNKNKDMSHFLANEILKTKSNIIVMEGLEGIKSKNKGKKFNNRQSQVSYYNLKQILTYKAPMFGKTVVTVDPSYTSKNDYRGLERGIRKGCRYYAIDGKVLDADWNAAINIAKKYSLKKKAKGIKLPISFSEPIDGKLNFIGKSYQQTNSEIMSRKLNDL